VTVTVVGTTPIAGVGVTIDKLPAPVQVATSGELQASGALDLSAFMNARLTGVHVNQMQGNPYQPDVSYRGYTASPLLGTPQGVSVYMDGVRLNQPFGDVVSLPGGRFYLSWYPACRFLSHAGIDPPDWKAQVTPELRRSVADETLARLAEIVPDVAALGAVTDLSMVDGGAVVTWGDSDIDDPHSEAHQRFDIGVTSNGSYHSVDTGKYSVAPYFAMQVADRIAAA